MRFRHSLLIALTILLTACAACGSNEDAIASARSLSQPRLAKLFIDLQALSTASGQDRMHIHARTPMPDAFSDFDPQSIVIDGHAARMQLSGCADDKVLLIVKGIGNSGRKEIILLPGEAKGAVVLWTSN